MRRRITTTLAAIAIALIAATAVQARQVTTETVPGVTNFARVETTVACAGSTRPEALAGIKRMGFASVVNLRMATETGADIEAGAAAAKAAGIRYVHLPFDSAAPDRAVVDRFLQVVSDPANQPAFIHCASANRAAALWLVKRVQVDRWTIERASEEAAALGLRSGALKQFALDYIEAARRP